ncbi:MAG: hypothetical protein IPL55_17825 [Saprospiraceae bacterium]|jgi:hypothetical protein|nr:hypothetical protein [Saprospiraceae bacterium]
MTNTLPNKDGIYYLMKSVKEADTASFTVYSHQLDDADAEDHSNRFIEGKIIK